MGIGPLADLQAAAQASGLAWRGAFSVSEGDDVPALADGTVARTLVLLGFAGRDHWQRFAASDEACDGAAHPLDRWSRRCIEALACRFGGTGLYPSEGPPWLPFQRWAMRAEETHTSPLGILIHPRWGLWHAYRGALAFATDLAPTPVAVTGSPCAGCAAKPCLTGCPVDAIAPGRYDWRRCAEHVRSAAGEDCLQLGCRARRACPVGAEHRYTAAEAEFHMRAFLR
ncbi:MAG: hypothetical protein WCH32_07425 [Pseudomonadota bacterium]